MAYSPSPQMPQAAPPGGAHRADGVFSATPPLQPLSKRDKRRSLLSDRLNELTASFTQNRDTHYRQQLQALQIDMNLIMRADPYANSPLDDSGEDIAELISATMGGSANGQWKPEGDVAALAGRWYAKFVDDVNNAMEDRDVALTMLERKYQRTLHDLHQANRYKVRLAQEEHRSLAETLRERLIQSVAQKKNRLMKEKEHLDIADSNALLLHPNQFSITNPASPGGHGNRKTRHTRHRLGDNDEFGSGLTGDPGLKRKRRAFEDNDIGSPGPGKPYDTGNGSPFRDPRARLTATQMNAPLYSIDRLFTEKELTMHLNHAAVAAAHHFAALKEHEHDGDNGTADHHDDTALPGTNTTHEGGAAAADDEATPTPAALEMDRTSSQHNFHATRSTRNTNNNNHTSGNAGLNLLGYLAASEKPSNLPSTLPVVLPIPINTRTGQAPHPPGLRAEDVEEDLARLSRLRRQPKTEVDYPLLEALNRPIGDGGEVYRVAGLLPLNPGGAAGSAHTALGDATPHPGADGVPMSAQSSLAGFSDIGAVPMNREIGSSAGGVGMKRSGSSIGNGDGHKRARKF
ncbi:MAG: hypothetical protein M1819_001088 [Sarea resinae]|nr:MAG: hypothetical protein M1819_001088 [Sarea resinae]